MLALQLPNFMVLPNYKLITHYCRSNHICGGSVVYIKQSFSNNLKPINCDNFIVEMCFEFCAIAIDLPGESNYCCVLNIYWSCDSDINIFFEKLYDSLFYFSKEFQILYVCGDFHINYFDCGSHKRVLIDLLKALDWESLVRSLLEFL